MNQRLTMKLAITSGLAAALPGRKEVSVQRTDVRPGFQEAVKAQSRGATIHGLSRDVEGAGRGTRVSSSSTATPASRAVGCARGGGRFEMRVKPDGRVVSRNQFGD
jgi:hypothetical protein